MGQDPETPLPIRRVKDNNALSPTAVAVTAAVFVILVSCCILVIFILPAKSGTDPAQAALDGTAESVALQGAIDPELKNKTDQARQHALALQARLESEGVEVWGLDTLQTNYTEAEAALSSAQEAYADGVYQEALTAYTTAIGLLETLDASRPERIEKALAAGESALQAGDATEAKRNFEIVLSLDPANATALDGLEAAKLQPAMRKLIGEAELAESSGDLLGALGLYQQILAMDTDRPESLAEVARLQAAIEEKAYQRAINAAVQALQAGKLDEAQLALAAARAIRPEGALLKELEGELNEQRLLDDISQMRQQALSAEATGDWHTAVDAYTAILKIDSTIAFAQTGIVQAEKLARLKDDLQMYLSDKDLLLSPGNVAHARELGTLVVEARPAGTLLHSMATELLDTLVAYETPALVRITSDGKTQVRIFRVGLLGTFTSVEKELLPGRYEIQGTRSGYRDVSFTFTVPPGAADYAITVTCKEKI
ncbi:MAG: tetratricopeptide repeat protein [Puniceicoccaceae bacterium]